MNAFDWICDRGPRLFSALGAQRFHLSPDLEAARAASQWSVQL